MKNKNRKGKNYYQIFKKSDKHIPLCFYLLHTKDQVDYANSIAKSFAHPTIQWNKKTGTKTKTLTEGSIVSPTLEKLQDLNIVYFKEKKRVSDRGKESTFYQLSPEFLFSTRNLSVFYKGFFREKFGCELDAESVWWLYFIPPDWFDDEGISPPQPYDLPMFPSIFLPRLLPEPKSGYQFSIEEYEDMSEKEKEEILDEVEKGKPVQITKDPSLVTPPPPPPSYLHTIIFRTIPKMVKGKIDVIRWLSDLPKFDYLTLLFYYLQMLGVMSLEIMGESIEDKEFPDPLKGYSYPPISTSQDELQEELLNQVKNIWEKMGEIKDEDTEESLKLNLIYHLNQWSSENRWGQIQENLIAASFSKGDLTPSLSSAQECFEGKKAENLLKNVYEQTKEFVLWECQKYWMGY